MKFKVDENRPVDCVHMLREAGHDALSVMDQSLVGTPDSQLAEICSLEDRVLVSLDLDFADIRTYPPSESAGLVVFRLRSQDARSLTHVVGKLIRLLTHESPKGKLWIVEEDKVRVRE